MRRLATSLAFTALALGVPVQSAAAVAIVVHPKTEVDSISKTELSRIFLKRLRSWSDGQMVEPVDQPPESDVRQEFSRLVHERSVIHIEVYWKRMIFSGRSLPPKELTTDEAVLDYVRKTPGAVGYVSADSEIGGVKKLSLVE